VSRVSLGEIFEKPQDDDRALTGRKLDDGPDDRVAVVAAGRGVTDSQFVGFAQPRLEMTAAMAPPVATVIDEGAMGISPRIIDPRPCDVQPLEDVLNQVFGGAAIARQSECGLQQTTRRRNDEVVEVSSAFAHIANDTIALFEVVLSAPVT
jgi:hypothetical protein